MRSQVRYEYNNTALPRNATNSSVLRTTAFWDAMQIKVSTLLTLSIINDNEISNQHNKSYRKKNSQPATFPINFNK